jgi:kumamolisin
MKAFDLLFQKAVKKGINICCASGDCAASDGVNDGHPHVDFPASSPNVVSCGGTTLTCPTGSYDIRTIETVWSFDSSQNTGTGAGYSTVFSKPTYQNNVIDSSISKRAICDISSNSNPATGYKILFDGDMYIMGGTSCSSPAIASFIALTGIKKFINPIIYYNQSSFHKITSGSNGFYSSNVSGEYSVCSGLGTPSSNLAQVLKLQI